MKEIIASPNRVLHLGYEGEDNVTLIKFPYDDTWLDCGDGEFKIRVLRHGDTQAYNATEVIDNRENMTLTMTVTDIELSVRGRGELQLVYICSGAIKKSEIYQYNVHRAIDSEVVSPPDGSIIASVEESLEEIKGDIGSLSNLTTTDKSSLVSAINEVNAKESGKTIDVDAELSGTSENPVQNKVISGALAGKADKTYVDSALSDKANTADVNTALSTKANTSDVNTALSAKANSSDVNSALSAKADKSYVDTEVAKAKVTVDSTVSSNSENPVQNKAVKQYVDNATVNKVTKFTVTISQENSSYVADKTYQQIAYAYIGGNDVVAVYNSITYPLFTIYNNTLFFGISGLLLGDVMTSGFAIAQDNTVTPVNESIALSDELLNINTALDTKASTDVATQLANGLMSSADKIKLDTVYADYSSALTALGVI